MTQTHERWLEARRQGVGGSDAAALVGMNAWSTPYSVWADKTGRMPPKEDNEAMRQGRDLEQYVADRWMEEVGKKCRRRTKLFKNKKYPWALGNIDRWVVGENAGLECKTTSVMNLKNFKNGEFPDNYYVQCVHYMAVTGADRWYLGVLVLNQGFYHFVIERDEDEIAALMETEREFWQEYVEKDTPPPVDGLKPTTGAIDGMYLVGYDDRAPIDLSYCDGDLDAYFALSEQIKKLEEQREKTKQSIKEYMGESTEALNDRHKVTWKNQTRRSFDVKAFTKDHSDIDISNYYKTTQSRVMRIMEVK